MAFGQARRLSSFTGDISHAVIFFSDQDETYHKAILEHVKYWVGAFLGARNLGSKLSYTENIDWMEPRLRMQLPKRAMFW